MFMITTLGKRTKLSLIGLNWNQLKEPFFIKGLIFLMIAYKFSFSLFIFLYACFCSLILFYFILLFFFLRRTHVDSSFL